MHAAEFPERGFGDEDVDRLRLIDVDAAICRHIDDRPHAQFVRRFVQRLEIVRDVEGLHASLGGDELIFELRRPEPTRDQIPLQMFVRDRKGTGQRRARVQIAGDGFEAFDVAEHLRGRRRRHGRDEQGIAHSALRPMTQKVPILVHRMRFGAP